MVNPMKPVTLKSQRQSARLSISIPLILSGVDAAGNSFRESVRTLIVNQHGGKITTSRHLKLGSEVTVENRALGVIAKARVVWLSPTHLEGEAPHIGVQLLHAQNVWGVEFTPDDWHPDPQVENTAAQASPPESGKDHGTEAEKPGVSPTSERASVGPVPDLQESADAKAQEFEQRLKRLTQKVGSEFEIDLREQTVRAEEGVAASWQQEVTSLKQMLKVAEEEIAKLETRIQELQEELQKARNTSASFLADAQHQLAALSKSILVSMNRAAETGLAEYRKLLQRTNQESAVRNRTGTEQISPPPKV